MTISLIKRAKTELHRPRKSPLLAGFLSTLIPGSGKIYSGRGIDGIFTFLVITLTGFRAYEGFSDDQWESARFWTYGSISGFFYLGNVYGSVLSARIVNNEADEKAINEIKVKFNVHF